jgi:hypothetical protein
MSRTFLVEKAEFDINHGNFIFAHELTTSRLYRVLARNQPMFGSKTVAYNLYNISGQDQGAPAVIAMLYYFPDVPKRMDTRLATPRRTESFRRILDLTSTALVLNNDVFYRMPAPLPRWSLYHRYLVEPDRTAELRRTLAVETDVHEFVVLNKRPSIPIAESHESGSVKLLRQRPEELLLESTALSNSLLLLTDTYYDGWRASVDGEETEILRANAAFRAIAVPAGKHQVRFHFRHPAFLPGCCLSCVSWAAFVLLAVLATRRRRPKQFLAAPT